LIKSSVFLIVIFCLSVFSGCTQTERISDLPEKHSAPPVKNRPPSAVKVDDPDILQSLLPYDSTKDSQTIMDEALDFCQASQGYWQAGDFKNAIEALDQAYLLISDVETDDDNKIMQQKEDIRFLISKRILEIYASRNIVLSGNHKAIPLVMNRHVERELKSFTVGREKSFFRASYKRSGKFRPRMVEALKKAGLPVELSWLPLIESGFKVNAFSSARALGLWQFIPSTGYRYGLKRNALIDERLDPIKATNAAIDYLTDLHNIFGDWSTVLAGYNCGEGRVLRVIREQKVNYLDDFWDLYERLPSETARYVPRFIATLHIVSNPEKYGLDSIDVSKPLEYETVVVSKRMSLKNIGKAINVPEKILKELNPEFRYKILPGEEYPLRIPPGKEEMLLSKIDDIPVSAVPRPAFVYHRIRPGESLSTIANKYRVSMGRIARANNIYKKHKIIAGKRIKIPQRGTTLSTTRRKPLPKYGKATVHKVKRGDSLWILARNYRTSVKKIRQINNLKGSKLYIGQKLNILGPPATKNKENGLIQYTVKKGDSPFTIAKEYNTMLKSFLRLNNLTPKSKIYPGQILYVE